MTEKQEVRFFKATQKLTFAALSAGLFMLLLHGFDVISGKLLEFAAITMILFGCLGYALMICVLAWFVIGGSGSGRPGKRYFYSLR